MVPAICTWPALLIAPNAEAPKLLLEVPFWAIYGKTPISDSCRHAYTRPSTPRRALAPGSHSAIPLPVPRSLWHASGFFAP